MKRWLRSLAMVGLLAGCTSDDSAALKAASDAPAVKRKPQARAADDHTLCDWKNRKDVEVSETAGPGADFPNIRRVWKVFGVGADRRKILICREVDTNLDGIKDTVRFYGDDGQSKQELADTNHDGKIDTLILFSKGRVAELWWDRNFDQKIDQKNAYVEGKLSRIKRDSKFAGDCKPSSPPPCPKGLSCDCRFDTFEIYMQGRLERIGVDLDGDGRVDRWDRDTEWMKKLAAAEQKRQDEEERKKKEESAARVKAAEAAAGVSPDASTSPKTEGAPQPEKKPASSAGKPKPGQPPK